MFIFSRFWPPLHPHVKVNLNVWVKSRRFLLKSSKNDKEWHLFLTICLGKYKEHYIPKNLHLALLFTALLLNKKDKENMGRRRSTAKPLGCLRFTADRQQQGDNSLQLELVNLRTCCQSQLLSSPERGSVSDRGRSVWLQLPPKPHAVLSSSWRRSQ